MSKPINRSKNTQLSDVFNFNLDNLIFDEPMKCEVTGVPVFYRINLGVRIGKVESDLIFELDRCKTFGVKENRDMTNNNLTGYSASILMFDQNEPTERQKKTLEVFESIVAKCQDHLLLADIKKKVGKQNLKVREQLDKLTPINFLKNKETEEPDLNCPILNAKLLYAKPKKDKNGNDVEGKIVTTFYAEDEVNEDGEPLIVDPIEIINKRGWIRTAVRFESIFVGGTSIKLQVKIYEAEIKIEENKPGPRRLLRFGIQAPQETVFEIEKEEDNISFNEPQETESRNFLPNIIADDDDDNKIKKTKKSKK